MRGYLPPTQQLDPGPVGPASRDLRADLQSLAQPVRPHEAEDAKRLKKLERENTRLKKIVADQTLEVGMLKELNRGNFWPRTGAGGTTESADTTGSDSFVVVPVPCFPLRSQHPRSGV